MSVDLNYECIRYTVSNRYMLIQHYFVSILNVQHKFVTYAIIFVSLLYNNVPYPTNLRKKRC